MTIAVDFDGCVCEHRFPEIGRANYVIIAILKILRKKGDKLILWTCRNGAYLEDAVVWCRKEGLEFDAVNEDLPEIRNSESYKGKSVKVYADIYLDDRNVCMDSFSKLFMENLGNQIGG